MVGEYYWPNSGEKLLASHKDKFICNILTIIDVRHDRNREDNDKRRGTVEQQVRRIIGDRVPKRMSLVEELPKKLRKKSANKKMQWTPGPRR